MSAVSLEAVPAGRELGGSTLKDAIDAARALERWCDAVGWAGTDPYDALSATRLAPSLSGSPLALRIFTQVVKRSPLNVRRLLGIPTGLSAATLAFAISAYARNGFLDPDQARRKLGQAVSLLASLRSARYGEPCWGYHFDVQTRAFFYPRTEPNTIATAFAGHGLLDAHELADEGQALELALGAGEYFLRHVPQTQAGSGAYFGYLPGDRTPIHNANMLVCALLARLSRLLAREDFAAAAAAGVRFTTSRQRPDGSWLYGESKELSWVDGFHTGYVIDGLLTCVEAGIGGSEAYEAWQRGLLFYAEALIEPDGTPRYRPDARHPIDSQCAAQAIHTLARAARLEPDLAEVRWRVLRFALTRLRRGDGAFVFQRNLAWTNRIPHPRWVQAPMLAALSQLIASTR